MDVTATVAEWKAKRCIDVIQWHGNASSWTRTMHRSSSFWAVGISFFNYRQHGNPMQLWSTFSVTVLSSEDLAYPQVTNEPNSSRSICGYSASYGLTRAPTPVWCSTQLCTFRIARIPAEIVSNKHALRPRIACQTIAAPNPSHSLWQWAMGSATHRTLSTHENVLNSPDSLVRSQSCVCTAGTEHNANTHTHTHTPRDHTGYLKFA